MKLTRNFVAALALLGFSGAAMAGSLDPVVEPTVIVEEATSSSSGAAVMAIIAIAVTLPLLTD